MPALPDARQRRPARLAGGVGVAAYAGLLFAFARPIVDEVLGLVRPRRTAPAV